MFLSELGPAKGSKKRPKRVGRGPGSGHGKTACKGHKGQKSRSGFKLNPGFEGGQMPLHRRLPKRGFKNIFRKEYQVVNIGRLSAFEGGTTVDPRLLRETGMIASWTGLVKILGMGELKTPLTVVADAFTKKARELIEAAGGTAQLRSETKETQS